MKNSSCSAGLGSIARRIDSRERGIGVVGQRRREALVDRRRHGRSRSPSRRGAACAIPGWCAGSMRHPHVRAPSLDAVRTAPRARRVDLETAGALRMRAPGIRAQLVSRRRRAAPASSIARASSAAPRLLVMTEGLAVGREHHAPPGSACDAPPSAIESASPRPSARPSPKETVARKIAVETKHREAQSIRAAK